MIEDMGVQVDVFSTCHKCGVPISKEINLISPTLDSWVDTTGRIGCHDSMNVLHEALTLPQPFTHMVLVNDIQVNSLRRIRTGRECRFICEKPDNSGAWLVSVPGLYGSFPVTITVHPNDVKEVDA